MYRLFVAVIVCWHIRIPSVQPIYDIILPFPLITLGRIRADSFYTQTNKEV